jgi:hypothetical protein
MAYREQALSNINTINSIEEILNEYGQIYPELAIFTISYELFYIFNDHAVANEFTLHLMNAWLSNINNNQIPFLELYTEACNNLN